MAGLTALGVLVLAAYTVVLVVEYTTYQGDDPLIGLAALFALVIGGWAALVAALAGVGWLLRRRRPSLAEGLVITALVLVSLPVVGGLGLALPGWL